MSNNNNFNLGDSVPDPRNQKVDAWEVLPAPPAMSAPIPSAPMLSAPRKYKQPTQKKPRANSAQKSQSMLAMPTKNNMVGGNLTLPTMVEEFWDYPESSVSNYDNFSFNRNEYKHIMEGNSVKDLVDEEPKLNIMAKHMLGKDTYVKRDTIEMMKSKMLNSSSDKMILNINSTDNGRCFETVDMEVNQDYKNIYQNYTQEVDSGKYEECFERLGNLTTFMELDFSSFKSFLEDRVYKIGALNSDIENESMFNKRMHTLYNEWILAISSENSNIIASYDRRTKVGTINIGQKPNSAEFTTIKDKQVNSSLDDNLISGQKSNSANIVKELGVQGLLNEQLETTRTKTNDHQGNEYLHQLRQPNNKTYTHIVREKNRHMFFNNESSEALKTSLIDFKVFVLDNMVFTTTDSIMLDNFVESRLQTPIRIESVDTIDYFINKMLTLDSYGCELIGRKRNQSLSSRISKLENRTLNFCMKSYNCDNEKAIEISKEKLKNMGLIKLNFPEYIPCGSVLQNGVDIILPESVCEGLLTNNSNNRMVKKAVLRIDNSITDDGSLVYKYLYNGEGNCEDVANSYVRDFIGEQVDMNCIISSLYELNKNREEFLKRIKDTESVIGATNLMHLFNLVKDMIGYYNNRMVSTTKPRLLGIISGMCYIPNGSKTRYNISPTSQNGLVRNQIMTIGLNNRLLSCSKNFNYSMNQETIRLLNEGNQLAYVGMTEYESEKNFVNPIVIDTITSAFKQNVQNYTYLLGGKGSNTENNVKYKKVECHVDNMFASKYLPLPLKETDKMNKVFGRDLSYVQDTNAVLNRFQLLNIEIVINLHEKMSKLVKLMESDDILFQTNVIKEIFMGKPKKEESLEVKPETKKVTIAKSNIPEIKTVVTEQMMKNFNF